MNIDEIRKKAGKISETYRKTNGISQTQLAKKAGVSLRSIYNIEHDIPVYDETLQKVMTACGWRYKIEVLRFLDEECS